MNCGCNRVDMAATLPFTSAFTRAQAEAAGYTRRHIETWLRRGLVNRIGRGVYVPSEQVSERVRWAALNSGSFAASMLVSAGLHQLWIPPSAHRSMTCEVRLTGAHLAHVVSGPGVTHFELEWTAVNLARYQQLPGALVVFDSALKRGANRDRLLARLDLMHRWPGTAKLCCAIDAANRLSGSALESWARGRFIEAGLPPPVLQRQFRVRGESFYVDFAWPNARLIGEADGEGKYANPAEGRKERLRQALLQDLGWDFSRFGWADVFRPNSGFLEVLRRKLA